VRDLANGTRTAAQKTETREQAQETFMDRTQNNREVDNSAKGADQLSGAELDTIVAGGGTQTAGGGNTSIWGKIKGLMFGVEPSFFD
jgi:alcohol dehydrogenase class IV